MNAAKIRADLSLRRAQSGPAALEVKLELPGRGVTAIFGPSGAGKTSLLRCIAGLEPQVRGYLQVLGSRWQDGDVFLPAHQRPLGYLFQEASLFPHLSVMGNLRFALKRAKPSAQLFSLEHVIQLLDLAALLQRRPQQLSGGERQRVALGRALLIQPRILLLDEPLAALEQARRQELLAYLQQLRDELDIPMLYVSHAMDEVARLADYLVLLDQGRVQASGALNDVLAGMTAAQYPDEDAAVVLFTQVKEIQPRWQLAHLAFAGGDLWVPDHGYTAGQQLRTRVLARDVSLALSRPADSSIVNLLQGEILELVEEGAGASLRVVLRVGASRLVARITRRSAAALGLATGMHVWLQIKSVAVLN